MKLLFIIILSEVENKIYLLSGRTMDWIGVSYDLEVYEQVEIDLLL